MSKTCLIRQSREDRHAPDLAQSLSPLVLGEWASRYLSKLPLQVERKRSKVEEGELPRGSGEKPSKKIIASTIAIDHI